MIAIAWERSFTGLPEPPDFKLPCLNLCITSSQGIFHLLSWNPKNLARVNSIWVIQLVSVSNIYLHVIRAQALIHSNLGQRISALNSIFVITKDERLEPIQD